MSVVVSELKGPIEIVWVGDEQVKIYAGKGDRSEYSVVYRLKGRKKRVRKRYASLARAYKYAHSKVPGIIRRAARMQYLLEGEEVVIYQRAREALDRLGVPLDTAVTEYGWMVKELGHDVTPREAVRSYLKSNPKCPPIELAKLAELYLASFVGRKRTRLQKVTHVTQFVTFMQNRHKSPAVMLHEIKREDLTAWYGDDGYKSHRMRAPNALYRFATETGYLPEGVRTLAEKHIVVRPVVTVEMQDEVPEIFQPEEVERIIAGLWSIRRKESGRVRLLYFVLICFAGIRPEEVLRLSWERNIDLGKRMIFLQPSATKTDRFRQLPISDNLYAWLLRLLPANPKKPLVPDQVSTAVIRVAKNVGVGWFKDAPRHSYGTFQLAMGLPVSLITDWMGNSPQIFYTHYRTMVRDWDDALCYWSIYPDGWDDAGPYRNWLPTPSRWDRPEVVRHIIRGLGETFKNSEAYAAFEAGAHSFGRNGFATCLNNLYKQGWLEPIGKHTGPGDRMVKKTARFLEWERTVVV